MRQLLDNITSRRNKIKPTLLGWRRDLWGSEGGGILQDCCAEGIEESSIKPFFFTDS